MAGVSIASPAGPGEEEQAPLAAGPMSRPQIVAACIAVLIAALDGYDLLAMAFAAPALTLDWGLDKATVGFLLSTALIGMAIGSLGLSPLADVAGRRPVVLGAIGLTIVGSLLSALSPSVPLLAFSRILTGMGIGTLVPLTTTIASEFVNAKSRPFAIAATTVGLPVGSIIGALVAALLLRHFGWHSVFLSGAIAGTMVLLVVAVALPESPAFLIARRPADALARLNRVMARLGRAPVQDLPPGRTRERASYKALFTPELIATTLRFVAIQVLVSTSAYYLINWLPQLIADMGFSPSTASLASAASSVVGIFSGLLFGVVATRFGPAPLAGAAMIGFGIAIAVFGVVPPHLSAVIVAASACGFFLNGCTGIFFATVAASFPPLSRVSGIGFVMGIGRVFSILGPTLAGWLFGAGLTRAGVSLIFGVAPVVAGLLLLSTVVGRRPKGPAAA